MSLLLLAVVVRGAVLYQRFDRLAQDPDAYRQLAENLSNYGGFGQVGNHGHLRPTAYRPPGYPTVLAMLVVDKQLPSTSVAILHLALGMGTVWLVFQIGQRLASQTVGVIAALLVTIDPILLNQSTLVMTETLATFITACSWWLFVRNEQDSDTRSRVSHLLFGVIVGLTLAAGYFVRPVFIVWSLFIVIVLLVSILRRNHGALLTALGICIVMVVSVGMWTRRNMTAVGKPIWATTHGGYTLLLGNNPPFYDYLNSQRIGEKWQADFFHDRWAQRRFGDPRTDSFWRANEIDQASEAPSRSEIQDDRLAQEAAIETIRRQPTDFIYSCIVRIGRLWSPMPHQGDQSEFLRWSVGLFYTTTFVFTAIGVWMLRSNFLQRHWQIAILLAVALSGVHTFYWSNMRMRSMMTPMLAVVSAIGCHRLLSRPTGASRRLHNHAVQQVDR